MKLATSRGIALTVACAFVGMSSASRASTRVSSRVMSTSCVSVGATSSPSDSQPWFGVEGRPELKFQIKWNAHFQVNELLWMNTGKTTAQFEFAVDSVAPKHGATHSRQLFANSREHLPGLSVIPSRTIGLICVGIGT